jgi:hypothetical protein
VAGVGISSSRHGTYVAWAFSGEGAGPKLIQEISDEHRRETRGRVPWLKWLRTKRYIKD